MTDKPKPNPSCDEACMFICSSEAKQAITAEREVSDKLENALRNLMEWQVVNVDKWHNSAYDFASATITKVSAIRATHTNREEH